MVHLLNASVRYLLPRLSTLIHRTVTVVSRGTCQSLAVNGQSEFLQGHSAPDLVPALGPAEVSELNRETLQGSCEPAPYSMHDDHLSQHHTPILSPYLLLPVVFRPACITIYHCVPMDAAAPWLHGGRFTASHLNE